MNPSVIVDKVSKRFELGAVQRETQLRDQIVRLLRAPLTRRRAKKDVLWALRDVSFTVPEGEVVGIIGSNGAGKSTLLKILSKITYPTSGRIRTRGRVAALLEVGTGFHEELTGRENIYLNGSILGMKKKEVQAKLDAIVEFSGVERFIDTPIKRYSSGMRLRLGFAVAAHLDPDVLIVDEVLAVGDQGFQKKCISAMEDMRGGGRTVLFVSHNMAAVENLCSRGIWIDSGAVRQDGPIRDVIKAYMESYATGSGQSRELSTYESRRGSGEIRFTRIELLTRSREVQNLTRSGDALVVRMHYKANEAVAQVSFGFRLTTDFGALITETSTWHHGLEIRSVEVGEGYVDLEIDLLNVLAGRYYLTPAVTTPAGGTHIYDYVDNALAIDVEPSNIYNSGVSIGNRYGLVYFPQRWHLQGMKRREPLVEKTGSRIAGA